MTSAGTAVEMHDLYKFMRRQVMLIKQYVLFTRIKGFIIPYKAFNQHDSICAIKFYLFECGSFINAVKSYSAILSFERIADPGEQRLVLCIFNEHDYIARMYTGSRPSVFIKTLIEEYFAFKDFINFIIQL
jgi:hypothetical protein